MSVQDDLDRMGEALIEMMEHYTAHRGSVRLAYADGWYQELTKHFYADRKFLNEMQARMEIQNRNWSGYSI